MPTDHSLVIIGASLAGAKAAESARADGFDGRVVLVGDEPTPPYERPPLSKAVLRGEAAPETTRVHDEDFYETNDIELLTGHTVEALDLAGHEVRLDGGERIPFTSVVLATGAAPRRLDISGATLDGVHYLRTVDDSNRLGEAIRAAGRVAVIGAGWIGSEVGASARQLGADVVLIDPLPVPLQRVLGDEIGAVFAQLHADHGVRLRMETGVQELRGGTAVEQVVLSNGDVEDADLVVIGVGVAPRVELAAAAGLDVDNGVVVDEQLRSSAPECLRRRRRRLGLAPVLPAATCASSTGPTPSTRGSPPAPTRPVAATSTTGCRTSSRTSTTSAWSTSATPTPATPSSFGAASPTESSSPSGSATASSRRR